MLIGNDIAYSLYLGKMKSKSNRLFLILGGFFITNALLAEFIGVKVFSVEGSLGLSPVNWDILGFDLSFNMTAGVLLWPVVFIMTDIINEYYGRKGVRILSFMASGLIAYSFLMSYLAIRLAPADFWTGINQNHGVPDMNNAFRWIFGQGNWIIVGSLTAFLVGQFLDVYVFQAIRKVTGEKWLWLRATGSTLISQLIDSFVVLIVAFYIGQNWSLEQVIAVGVINYIYKFVIAIVLTPTLYLVHSAIDQYLGPELSAQMIEQAVDKEMPEID